jgi:rubrerythrin
MVSAEALEDMTDKRPARRPSIFDILRSKSEEEREMVTVREEKKSLLRVIKAKPRAIKHMSEVLETKSVTAEEMKITESVVERVVSVPDAPKSPKAVGTASPSRAFRAFTCVECGTRLPAESDVCPRCHARYLMDLSPEAVAELERAASAMGDAGDYEDEIEDFAFDEFPIIHFDAMDGVINYLEHGEGESDLVLECGNCGTLIQLDIDRCPLCGATLEVTDAGLVNLIRDGEFADEDVPEMECPQCGEHVVLMDGKCPACGSVILDRGVDDAGGRKVIPLIRTENVVFVHIDLETGDLNYLQRHLNRAAIEHMSIQLEGMGDGRFEEDWHSLSRI